jgi:hypothetical protein
VTDLTADRPTSAVDAPGGPLSGALEDVWARTRARTGPTWRQRFVGHVAGYLAANVWEAGNRARGRVPSLTEYARMRRHTSATALFFDLAEAFSDAQPAEGGPAGLRSPRRWSAGSGPTSTGRASPAGTPRTGDRDRNRARRGRTADTVGSMGRQRDDRPHRHHYLFAHRELPMAAFRYGTDLVRVARGGNLAEGLAKLWVDLGKALPPADRLPADGLAATWHNLGDHEIALVTMPPAAGVTDAHLAAIVVTKPDGLIRYLVLERGVSDAAGQPTTVLGEWLADGDHVNLGAGPPPEPESFLAVVRERVGG